jgi:hypothetical protein
LELATALAFCSIYDYLLFFTLDKPSLITFRGTFCATGITHFGNWGRKGGKLLNFIAEFAPIRTILIYARNNQTKGETLVT